MRAAKTWQDYEIIDASGGEKLERWGDVHLIRPDPQIIWNSERRHPLWKNADAVYHRAKSGGGTWEKRSLTKEKWSIGYRELSFQVSPTGFKHTGLFPEQAVNWDYLANIIKNAGRPVKVLNLFAYTGGATLACAAAGAEVCHVDASKGMVQWAKENAALSSLEDAPIRWIVDDCQKFVAREIRREKRYDGIILDPPSYGRGPGGEVWKLEEQIFEMLTLVGNLLDEQSLFLLLNSYTTGLSASVMEYLLGVCIEKKHGGKTHCDEIGLPVTESGLVLPCGSSAFWENA